MRHKTGEPTMRRKVMATAAAVFFIGVALAAQPTSVRADRQIAGKQTREPWVPGSSMVIAAHEVIEAPPAPPR